MNKALLVGRITTKPELRTTSSGIPFTRFSVAINRPFTNNGERTADFINILVWRKQAENVCNFLDKGSQVAIEGRIQTRNYDGADGKKVYVTEVVADNFEFLETKGQKTSTPMSDVSNDIEYSNAPSTNVSDEPYIDFGDTIELSDDDIAF